MSDKPATKKSLWQSPFFYVAVVLSCLFLGFFYLAVTNEPDYMPSQKQVQNHSAHQATVSSEATAAEMNMSEEEHANMSDASSAHGH